MGDGYPRAKRASVTDSAASVSQARSVASVLAPHMWVTSGGARCVPEIGSVSNGNRTVSLISVIGLAELIYIEISGEHTVRLYGVGRTPPPLGRLRTRIGAPCKHKDMRD